MPRARRLSSLLSPLLVLPAAWLAAAPSPDGVPVTPAAAPPGPADTRPHFVHRAERGFFDDPFALHPERPLLVLINTDSASFADVEIVDVQANTRVARFAVGDPQQIYERVLFTGAGRALVVITRDPTSGKRAAQRYDEDGKPAGLVGPVTDFGSCTRGGRPLLVAWERSTDRKGETVFAVAAHDLETLARVSPPRGLSLGKDGLLRRPRVKPLGFIDGYCRLVAQEPGGFDKKRDMRLPDRAAMVDVLRGEVAWRSEIADLPAWANANNLRARQPNRAVFLQPMDMALALIDAMGGASKVALPVPFEFYDPRSLETREHAGGRRVVFSLAVDPLNPRALSRRKADAPKMDFYEIAVPDPGARKGEGVNAQHLLRVGLDDRPVGWAVEGAFVAVMRKFKAFSRGGDSVELYRRRE